MITHHDLNQLKLVMTDDEEEAMVHVTPQVKSGSSSIFEVWVMLTEKSN